MCGCGSQPILVSAQTPKINSIEKATGQNHPLRSAETFIEEHLLDDDMIKKLYGLC